MSEKFKEDPDLEKSFEFSKEFDMAGFHHVQIPKAPEGTLEGIKNFDSGKGMSLAIFADSSKMKIYARAYHGASGKIGWYEAIPSADKN